MPAQDYHNEGDRTWIEYRRQILTFCQETHDRLDKIEERILQHSLSINSLQIKMGLIAAITGFIGGLLPAIVQLLIHFL